MIQNILFGVKCLRIVSELFNIAVSYFVAKNLFFFLLNAGCWTQCTEVSKTICGTLVVILFRIKSSFAGILIMKYKLHVSLHVFLSYLVHDWFTRLVEFCQLEWKFALSSAELIFTSLM